MSKQTSHPTLLTTPINLMKQYGMDRQQMCIIVSAVYTKAHRGLIFCWYEDGQYKLKGSHLPVHPDNSHLHPNGWSMQATIKEPDVIAIATGTKDVFGIFSAWLDSLPA